MYDYDGLIRDVVLPDIEEPVWVKPWNELKSNFTEDSKAYSGHKIIKDIRTSITSNARNYTKADVDPVAGSFGSVTAYWTKIYQETAAEVHNIDISEAGSADTVANLFTDAVKAEQEQLWELIYDDCYAHIKLDLTAAGTYSDAALNRSTYTVLAPYNEITDTALTPALVRNCQFNTRLNKATSDNSGYRLLMEPTVYHGWAPQVQLLHSWVINDAAAGQPQAQGWQPVGNFEGTPVVEVRGATVGDVFFVRPQDVHICAHRKLSLTPVPSGRDSVKVIMRCGINAYVLNVGKQGMMTNKD